MSSPNLFSIVDLPPGDLLVTGATGFLGGRLVRALLTAGLPEGRLRCLVRDRERARAGGLPDASLWVGDLVGGGAAVLPDVATGVGAVVHLAGCLKTWRRADYDPVNVAGTGRLVDALRRGSPRAHLVDVSSLSAAGPSVDGLGSTEPPAACRPVSGYGDSKRRGELLVVASGLPHTIVRPPVVYGPGDAATRLLFQQALAPLVAVPFVPRPLSVVHADDVVRALLAALAVRPVGAVVALDGPQRSDTHALLRAVAAACGRRARLVGVPMPIAGAAAAASDVWARLRRKASFFNRDKVREIRAAGWVADGSAARALLGFVAAIDLAAGLAAVARSEGFAAGSATSATA